MDLPVIGAHCQLELCGSLDLLPIECNGCQRLFCRYHIALSSHSCWSLNERHNTVLPLPKTTTTAERERCAFDSCHKVSLDSLIKEKAHSEHRVTTTCPHCAAAFCAAHRHPSDHACTRVPSAPAPSEKNPEAHALLQKHFAVTSTSKVSESPNLPRPPTDPKKLARLRAVELMKMRHHAMPADPKDKIVSVPASQRIHLNVRLDTVVPVDQIFWLRKTVGTGKALDLIAERLSVRISDSTPACLEKISLEDGSSTRLRNDKQLSEQIEDGETLRLAFLK